MSRALATAPMHLYVRLPTTTSIASCESSRPLLSFRSTTGRQLQLQLHVRLLCHDARCSTQLVGPRPLTAVAVDIRVGQGQWRHQSTSGRPGPRARPPPPPRRNFLRLLVRAIAGSVRSLFMPFQGQTLKKLYRQNPEELVLALAVLVACVFVLAYVFRIYFTYFYSRQFTRYPPPVAKYLRRALYFSNYSPDPKRALKNYKLALEQCDELGLDPFSDDVLGIRIQLAAWLEKVQNYDGAIKILELLLSDCRRWVDLMETSVQDGAADGTLLSARLPAPAPRLLRGGKAAAAAEGGQGQEGGDADADADEESLWGRRSRILRKAIGISIKLGELYADEHVLNADLSHERLVWSVDMALKEFKRRTADGAKAGEGEWMSPKEMGAALESLGLSYESRSQFHLALPLFFQALRVCQDPCHSAVIMNNLAISFAQHPLQPPYDTVVGSLFEKPSATPPTQEEARKAYLETAERWATNAHHHAIDTKGDVRTPECDEACAVALCNLGDIAAMNGDFREARRRFQEGRAMSDKVGFAAGVQQADAGLRRLPPP